MNLNLMKHNKKVWIQTIILTGGFVLFLGYVLIGVNIKNLDTDEEQMPDLNTSAFQDKESQIASERGSLEEQLCTQAGAEVYFSTDSILFTPDEKNVTEAERRFGTNIEVISESERRWREIKEELGNVAVTTAGNYVNVREEAMKESGLIGKAYTGAVVEVKDCVQDEEGTVWYQISSGEVEGYASAAFFLTGESLVNELSEETEYLSEEYLNNKEEWKLAITLEEENRLRKEELERLRQQQQADQKAIESNTIAAIEASLIITEEAKAAARNGDTSLLREQMISYAMQFLGNRYINGGRSLVDGTDCSGFTCYIYRDFGYTIDRTPAAQYQNAGRSVTLEEARPGDIVCYGKSSVTHVALYMGNGKIIHSANSRKGVVIYDVGYDNIIGIKSVMD